MITYEISQVDGVLVIRRWGHAYKEAEVYQFSEGEMIELTVDNDLEFRINGRDFEADDD